MKDVDDSRDGICCRPAMTRDAAKHASSGTSRSSSSRAVERRDMTLTRKRRMDALDARAACGRWWTRHLSAELRRD